MMKILGRILIISFVFVLFAGLMMAAVNASGMNAPDFREGAGRSEFRPPDGGSSGDTPPDGERRERGDGGSRLMFGLIKNTVVIGVLVTVIVWPKNIAKKKKRLSQQK